MAIEPNDSCRFPVLTGNGHAMLRRLREHPAAPIFRNASGHRLHAEQIEQVLRFEKEVAEAHIGWPEDGLPDWLPSFVERCIDQVPFHRNRGLAGLPFTEIAPVSRADLSRDIAQFVPDDLPLGRLLQFATSGTSGHPLLVPSHPVVAASYLSFHKRALARFGITLRAGAGDVGVALIGDQKRCFTYASVTPAMGESGLVKLNLNPEDWNHPDDRVRYLDDLAPEVITGDPLSLATLMALPLRHKPVAILSTSMTLSTGLRAELESRFGCPVLDIYSMNEAGPVAVYDPSSGGHALLQHRLYVEILERSGNSVPPGERGEVTLTGGFNPYLPLLRYRTGDQAGLVHTPGGPVLVDFNGRPPVRFRTRAGAWMNNVDVTHAMNRLALPQFGVHQNADGALVLRLRCGSMPDAEAAKAELVRVFGTGQAIELAEIAADGKIIQYTSDLAGAMD